MNPQASSLTAEGRAEAARANALEMRRAEAASEVRERYAARITEARWPRRIKLWLTMHKEIHHAKAQVEREVAPRDGLYLRDG